MDTQFLWVFAVIGFYAIHRIGFRDAAFLYSFNAVWVAALNPFILRQHNTLLGWFAIGLGLLGLYLLYQPEFGDSQFIGRSIALAAGACSGTAHMMIARAGRSNSALTVVFYLCFVSTCVHLVWFYVDGFVWPSDAKSWILLIGSGLFASAGQILMTKAYQIAPAAFISAVSYATPVFNLLVGAVLFSLIPNSQGLLGAFIILIGGVALPFLQERRLRLRSEL